MEKRSMWWFRFSTASLVLIPAAVGINYIGKLFAGVLKLPLWLDAIGTISGAVNNIIYGLTMDPISFVYGITSLFIGLIAGVMTHKGWIQSWGKAVIVGLAVGLTAVVISTPLNVAFWGGQTGNLWGDAVFAAVMAKTSSIWLASFLDEIVVDLPDKVLVVLAAYAIYRGLPDNVRQMFHRNSQVEELD